MPLFTEAGNFAVMNTYLNYLIVYEMKVVGTVRTSD